MIIQQRIRETVNLLSTPTRFISGPRDWQNLKADEVKVFPVSFLDTPVKSKDNYTQGGYIANTYPLTILFLERAPFLEDKKKLNWDMEAHDPILDRMRKLSREFILRLKANEAIEKVENTSTDDVVNLYDANLSGVMVTFSVTPRMEDLNICIDKCEAAAPDTNFILWKEGGVAKGRILQKDLGKIIYH